MKIIVISSSRGSKNELEVLPKLFEAGLQSFHLRKPGFSQKQLSTYLTIIPYVYRNRIVLHSHHELCNEYNLRGVHFTRKHYSATHKVKNYIGLNNKCKYEEVHHKSRSFHSLSKLTKCKEKYNYVFLSPVFDSISKKNYRGAFCKNAELLNILTNLPNTVIALGGIDIHKIEEIKQLGFGGVALLGTIWKSDDPLNTFLKIKEKCEQLSLNDETNKHINSFGSSK